jgi:hypothetical protein
VASSFTKTAVRIKCVASYVIIRNKVTNNNAARVVCPAPPLRFLPDWPSRMKNIPN